MVTFVQFLRKSVDFRVLKCAQNALKHVKNSYSAVLLCLGIVCGKNLPLRERSTCAKMVKIDRKSHFFRFQEDRQQKNEKDTTKCEERKLILESSSAYASRFAHSRDAFQISPKFYPQGGYHSSKNRRARGSFPSAPISKN